MPKENCMQKTKLVFLQFFLWVRRVRLLPILVSMVALVLTVKVNKVYQQISIEVGAETYAQSTPSANVTTESSSNENPVQSLAQNPKAPTSDSSAMSESPAQTLPAPPKPTDPLEYTDEEVEVLQQLAKRREELEKKSRQLDEREAIVSAAEQRMEQKMVELKALQSTVEDLLKKRSDEEEQRLQALVLTYEKMKPKDAAQVFEEMDIDLLADIVSRMKPGKSAPILAVVTPTRVKELTFELAEQKALPLTP